MLKRSLLFSGYLLILFSISFSCSSKETKKDNNSPDSLKHLISIPPGTADVKAEILKYSKDESDFICRLKIREVFEYGASISPIPPNSEIEAYISKNLFEKEENKIKEGEIVSIRISKTSVPGDKEYWTITMFNN